MLNEKNNDQPENLIDSPMIISFEEDLYQEVIKKQKCNPENISFEDILNENNDINNTKSIKMSNPQSQAPKKVQKKQSQLIIKPRPPSSQIDTKKAHM